MSVLSFPGYLIQQAFNLIAGGDPFIIGMIALIVLAAILFKLNVSLPTSTFLVVLTLGMISVTFDFSSSITNKAGPFTMLYLLVIGMGGVLLFNLMYRRMAQS